MVSVTPAALCDWAGAAPRKPGFTAAPGAADGEVSLGVGPTLESIAPSSAGVLWMLRDPLPVRGVVEPDDKARAGGRAEATISG